MANAAEEVERARIELLRAQHGVLVWNIDPTPGYTPAVRAGADRAVAALEAAQRRIQRALDGLNAELAEADAGRTATDDAGQVRTVPSRSV